MTLLDHSPAPGAAPAGRRIRSHALTEAKLLVRNGEQLLLALVIPIAFLVGGKWFGHGLGLPFDTLAPSVLALALWSTCFTSLAITVSFERRYGVLERLSPTPLGRGGLLLGKALALLLVTAGQLVILSVVAVALGWRPVGGALPTLVMVVTVVLGGTAFAALGMLLGGTLRSEVTLGLANLVYLVLLMGGAIMLPVASYPEAIRPVIALLPTAAVGEALRAWSDGTVSWQSLIVGLVWSVLGALAARKAFRWTS
ncbi:ABC-2 type transport system permease protein [Raineyella antarctica]|uniref:ABC-2 type transport system permease protein n=1 Tax=Raineyella antarctica TaxID=1577474 RepID=A0A1G6H148_9ACTN|nr:ABC transporter permease [Raineyella antarctica]SDB88037.1 ABC-2 type transport system permease protein [Raineyella antarctica]